MGTKRQTTHFELGDEFARALAETTQSLVCVLDESGVLLLFNDACERATGFSREEVVGRPLADTLIPPEEAEAFREVLAFIWKSGHSSPQVGHWGTKDGGRRLIAWSNKLVPATADSPAYLVTAGLDLTDRPQTQDEPALAGDPGAKLVEIGELAQEQRALRRVATLVASEASPESVFMAVSAECARVLGVTASSVWRYEGDDTATVVGRYNRDGIDSFPLGARLYVDETTSMGRARETAAPARVEDWGTAEGEFAGLMLQLGYRSTVSAPIIVAGTLWGAVTIGSADPLPREHRVPARRVLRPGLARGRERTGPRGPAVVARPHRPRRRRAAAAARAEPARRRPAAARRGDAAAPRRAGTARQGPGEGGQAAPGRRRGARRRARGAARARTRAPSRLAHRARASAER